MNTKFYALVAGLMLAVTVVRAQLPDFSVAPQWNAVDLDTVEHDLYSYLDSGYAVFMDLSAAWCGPCWTIHQNGLLDDLYDDLDRPGSNELRVLYIESEPNNTTEQLFGVNGGTNVTATQGNWVDGHDFPFIDDASIGSAYQLAAFPTLVFVGADRLTRTRVGSPGPSVDQVRAWMDEDAGPALQGADPRAVSYDGDQFSICGEQFDAGVLIQNHGTDMLTELTVEFVADGNVIETINWTGSLASYATERVTFEDVINDDFVDMQIRISNPDDLEMSNNVIEVGLQVVDVATELSWDIENSPAASIEIPSNLYNDPDDQFDVLSLDVTDFNGLNTPLGGFGQSAHSLYWNFFDVQAGEASLYLERMDLSAVPSPSLVFSHAYAQFDATTDDRLVISVSTNCGLSWMDILDLDGSDLATAPIEGSGRYIADADEWVENRLDLSQFANEENVTIRFRGITDYGNSLWIDDISVEEAVSTTNIEYVRDFQVFPNPASEFINVNITADQSSDVIMNITDMTGRVVEMANDRLEVGANYRRIDVSGYTAGLYTVSFADGKSVSNKVFSVVR